MKNVVVHRKYVSRIANNNFFLATAGLLLLLLPCLVILLLHRPSPTNLRLPNFVIVHIRGDSKGVTSHLDQILLCVHQLRLFNKLAPIYVLLDDEDIVDSRIENHGVVLLRPSDVPLSDVHIKFRETSKLNPKFRGGFWSHTSERFYYLADIVSKFSLQNVVLLVSCSIRQNEPKLASHVVHFNSFQACFEQEYDNLVYQDFSKLLPILRQHYEIGAPFDGKRAVAGLMYVGNVEHIQGLVDYMSDLQSKRGLDDMSAIGSYRFKHPEKITPLPVVNEKTYPEKLDCDVSIFVDIFGSVFDAAAYGQVRTYFCLSALVRFHDDIIFLTYASQYIGGVDPRNIPGNTIGYVSPDACYKVDKMKFQWRREHGLFVPFVDGLRINNLHIHSKDLARWMSDRKQE